MPILPSFGLATHDKHVRIKHTFEQIGATTIVGKNISLLPIERVEILFW